MFFYLKHSQKNFKHSDASQITFDIWGQPFIHHFPPGHSYELVQGIHSLQYIYFFDL